MIFLIVKFLLFSISFMGYAVWASGKLKIRCEFVPILYCSMVSNLMFAAGVLNLMPETVLLLFVGGYAALILSLKRGYRLSKRELFLYSGFGILLLYFSWLLRGAHYTHYDNFTHWAIVVKDMLLNDRMPNFADDCIIMFQSYPLGSSLFIYYAAKILGNTDACLLWAQVFMMMCAVFSMLVFIKKKNWYLTTIVLLFGAYSLVMNISIYDLLVDTLLPLAGIAAICIIYFYRTQPRKAIADSSAVFIFLLNIKNSGIFFYVICLIFLLVYIGKDIKRYWRRFAVQSVALPIATLMIWKKHVCLVFRTAGLSMHSMSLTNYKNVFGEKTVGEISSICMKMKEAFFSLSDEGMQCMLIITLFALVTGDFCYRKKDRYFCGRLCRMTLAVWMVMLAYQLCVLLMYLFSMPSYEASFLTSYGRYEKTAVLFVVGMFLVFLLDEWGSMENKWGGVYNKAYYGMLVLFCLAVSLAGTRNSFSSLIVRQNYESTERYRFQELVKQYDVPLGKRYLIYRAEDDSGYLYYLARYEFWSGNVSFATDDSICDWDNIKENYDYIIVLGNHELTETLEGLGYKCPDSGGSFIISVGDFH